MTILESRLLSGSEVFLPSFVDQAAVARLDETLADEVHIGALDDAQLEELGPLAVSSALNGLATLLGSRFGLAIRGEGSTINLVAVPFKKEL